MILTRFRDTLETCGLEDLGYQGPDCTWSGTRAGGAKVRCRLDRVVANQVWQQLFPWCKVMVRNGPLSDHCALVLHCLSKQVIQKHKRSFRLEHMWFFHADFSNEVSQIWRADVYGASSVLECIANL